MFVLLYGLLLLGSFGSSRLVDIDIDYFQLCQVQLPDHYVNHEWIVEPFPGYCYLDKVPKHLLSKPSDDCESSSVINYCRLADEHIQTYIQQTQTPEPYWIMYRCNVYNSTTGTFFFSGRVWPEYVKCK